MKEKTAKSAFAKFSSSIKSVCSVVIIDKVYFVARPGEKGQSLVRVKRAIKTLEF
jgi:hypothetical protein